MSTENSKVTRKSLLDLLTKKKVAIVYSLDFNASVSEAFEQLLNISKESLCDDLRAQFDKEVLQFSKGVPSRLKKCHRDKSLMIKRYPDYFDKEIILVPSKVVNTENLEVAHHIQESQVEVEDIGEDLGADGFIKPSEPEEMSNVLEANFETPTTSTGFKSRSEATQWRHKQKILKAADHDRDAVLSAGVTVLKNESPEAAFVLKRLSDDPNLAKPLAKFVKDLDKNYAKMDDNLHGWDENNQKVTPIKCLAYLLECNLTRDTWNKNPFKDAPCYSVVVKEKSKCRPSRPIPPTGTSVQVPMQGLVDHTVDRVLLDKGIIDHVKQLKEKHGSVRLEFIYKLGMDGSKGHPVFRQEIPDDRVQGACLLSQMVPLQLVAKVPGQNMPLVLWDFKHCNSKVSVRPLHMWMVEEDPNAKTEIDRLNAEIENLTPHKPQSLEGIQIGGVEVDDLPIFCCCDGKMINCQLDNRWQARCPFCSAVPKDLRDGIDLITDLENLRNLPVSPLHVLLRTGESYFKAGFRLKAGVFLYDAPMTEEEGERVDASKQAIIAAFEEVNLPIFKLQEDGNGTTMTGNLMRRIFRDHPQLFSDTTGIPLAVIKNTWTLYQAGVSRLPINPEAFSKLADETYRLYREVVPWYPICASFHRMLRHWPEILRLLPPTISIGMLSEEPGESINKDLKSFQLNHAPQTGAIQRNVATFDRLMDRSDPEILRHYNIAAQKCLDRAREPYCQEVLDLCSQDYLNSENFVPNLERVISLSASKSFFSYSVP